MRPHPWAHLSAGPDVLRSYQRALVAGRNASSAPEAAERIAAEPRSAEVLSRFGMECKAITIRNPETRRDRIVWAWFGHYGFELFWRSLTAGLERAICSSGLPDGRVLQTLATIDALQAWETARTSAHTLPAITGDNLPTQLAAAAATLGGIPWTLDEDGAQLSRILANQPLRLIPPHATTPLKGYLKNDLPFDIVGWAYLPAATPRNDEPEHALVYLSAVGPHKRLKAVWAALMDSKRDCVLLPLVEPHTYDTGFEIKHLRARRPEGRGVFQTIWNDTPLPASGLAHLAITSSTFLRPRSGQPFLHLTGADGSPDLSFFLRQMDLASTYPIDPAWAEQLWKLGLAQGLITILPAHGCAAFWVDTRDELAWATIIAHCAGAPTAHIETFGAERDAAPAVAMVISEHAGDPSRSAMP